MTSALRSKTFGFLNSPLGIWLLSSVAFGAISTEYARYQDNLQAQREHSQRISRLDIEAFERIHTFDVLLRSLIADHDGGYSVVNGNSMADVLNVYSLLFQAPSALTLSDGRIVSIPAAFPEFSDRSFKSVVLELSFVVSDEERESIGKKLDWMEYNYVVMSRERLELGDFYENARKLRELDRWHDYARPTR